MLTEFVSPHPIFAGAIGWPDGRTTIVVKITLTVGAMGALEPTPIQDPLTLDVTDERGEVLYPSDFAPYKPACDVSIVGDAVADRADPGRLSLDALVRTVEPRETLGPRQTFCPQGDPTDAAAFALWTTGGIDFARFQIAPPDRRLPWPGQGFTLGYARGSVTIHARFNGPTARVSVLSHDRARLLARLPVPLDTVLFDPMRRKAWVVFRGVYAPGANGIASRCAIELSTMPVHDVGAMASWRANALDTPVSVRSAPRKPAPPRPPVAADETRVLSGPVESANLPFSLPRAAPVDPPKAIAFEATVLARPVEHGDVTAPALRVRAETLPFQPAAGPKQASSPFSRQDLGELRSRGAQPVASAWEAGNETRVARPAAPEPSGRPEPEPPGPAAIPMPARMAPLMEPARQPLMQLQVQATPAPAAPAPISPPAPMFVLSPMKAAVEAGESRASTSTDDRAAGSAVGGGPMTDDRFQEILQEVWKGDRSLAETLARHGLSEEAWREEKRARKKR